MKSLLLNNNMNKEIPQIEFAPNSNEQYGFEIVPIQKIARNSHSYEVNPEKPHQLKFFNLIFITKGASKHFIDFKWYNIEKNTLIYLTKEQINAFQFTDDLDGYCLIFTEDFFVRCFTNFPKDFVFRLFNPQLFSPLLTIPKNATFLQYVKILNEESKEDLTSNQKVVIESLFAVLVAKAEELKKHQTFHISDSSKTKTFMKFMKLLENHFSQNRSALFYANHLAITYKHLNTICHELVNKTAKTVISDYIILQAKRSLINSEIKSTELAYKLGFEDPTNFSKYFKKSTGLTPKEFKNEFKQ